MVVDGGLPTRAFADTVESGPEFLDRVKFGRGTAIVTNHIASVTRRFCRPSSAMDCSSARRGRRWRLPPMRMSPRRASLNPRPAG